MGSMQNSWPSFDSKFVRIKLFPKYSKNGKCVSSQSHINHKAIRSMAVDSQPCVHKIVPKSDDAKEPIYDTIKPNALF